MLRTTLFAALVAAMVSTTSASWAGKEGRSGERLRMVERQLVRRGVSDPRVLQAMRDVPRHRFVPHHLRDGAYADGPLPIGHGQTISQPFIVAKMTEVAEIAPTDKVFELGTGSGYQAAVASRLAAHVYTVEIVAPLAERAREILAELGYDNVTVRSGDGYAGWPEHAPFDAILVTAAAQEIPPALLEQLKPGGRMVLPVGSAYGIQELMVVAKGDDGVTTTRALFPVRFVPVTGKHGEP